jgi:hypothetical protein
MAPALRGFGRHENQSRTGEGDPQLPQAKRLGMQDLRSGRARSLPVVASGGMTIASPRLYQRLD